MRQVVQPSQWSKSDGRSEITQKVDPVQPQNSQVPTCLSTNLMHFVAPRNQHREAMVGQKSPKKVRSPSSPKTPQPVSAEFPRKILTQTPSLHGKETRRKSRGRSEKSSNHPTPSIDSRPAPHTAQSVPAKHANSTNPPSHAIHAFDTNQPIKVKQPPISRSRVPAVPIQPRIPPPVWIEIVIRHIVSLAPLPSPSPNPPPFPMPVNPSAKAPQQMMMSVILPLDDVVVATSLIGSPRNLSFQIMRKSQIMAMQHHRNSPRLHPVQHSHNAATEQGPILSKKGKEEGKKRSSDPHAPTPKQKRKTILQPKMQTHPKTNNAPSDTPSHSP